MIKNWWLNALVAFEESSAKVVLDPFSLGLKSVLEWILAAALVLVVVGLVVSLFDIDSGTAFLFAGAIAGVLAMIALLALFWNGVGPVIAIVLIIFIPIAAVLIVRDN
jgi:hypothetical protein